MGLDVLVVDDSMTARCVLKKAMELAEVPVNDVLEAANGREALDLLEKKRVDLIVTDLNMPEMDGIALVDGLAERGIIDTVPVVIMSTDSSEDRVTQLRSKGTRGYLRKPFTPNMVRQVLEHVLGAGYCRPRHEVLVQDVSSVMKSLARFFSEPADRIGFPAPNEGIWLATVPFSGPLNGELRVAMDKALGGEIVDAIFVGQAEPYQKADMAEDAVKEMANILCGHVLSSLAGLKPASTPSPPQLETVDQTHWQDLLSDPQTVPFWVDELAMLVQLEVQIADDAIPSA